MSGPRGRLPVGGKAVPLTAPFLPAELPRGLLGRLGGGGWGAFHSLLCLSVLSLVLSAYWPDAVI